MKLITWDRERAKLRHQKQIKTCLDSRLFHEQRWIRNERTIYSTSASLNTMQMKSSLETNFLNGLSSIDGSDADMAVAYVFKNFRFIHAQMSANPPSVAMRPTSSDQEDHRKADAADRIVRWSIRKYKMQERMDQVSLHALLYGTGLVKTVWDSNLGDIVGFDEEKDEVELEGDINVSVPFIWNIFIDPDAKCWDDVKYIYERIYMDYEEACARWPSCEDILKKCRVDQNQQQGASSTRGRETQLDDRHYNAVELWEYWETGLPTNGFLGRYTISTADGDCLEDPKPNPYRFRAPGAVSELEQNGVPEEYMEHEMRKLPEKAKLPYHIITDIDIPNMVWGRSFIEYAAQLQDNLNRLDTGTLDNIQAHGLARMIVSADAEIAEDGISDSPWDITKITTNIPPYFMQPPALMPEMTKTRQDLVTGIDAVCGVNENMFGNQSREQSGASMQYATNQGNMVRRRLFNKYVLITESVYAGILNLVRKHWTTKRIIHVLGKEKALEAIDVKGTDIDGGYDVVGEYGVTLSLDPITRREEILQLQPLFEKAGVPVRSSLKMLKLNELESMFDELELAENRQKEIFDAMIASRVYIKPKPFRDHENMMAWALKYFMTQEFETLDEEVQKLCEQHILERSQVAAQEKSGALGGAPVPAAAPVEAAGQAVAGGAPAPEQAGPVGATPPPV